jgi:ATP-binding cassette subfamily F protein 3
MIEAIDLSLRRGAKLLMQDVNFRIGAGWKVGVIGANGVGKSSLFAALTGRLDPDRGELRLPKAWGIAEVQQTLHGTDQSVLDFAMAGDGRVAALNVELERAEAAEDYVLQSELHEALLAAGANSLKSRAATLLDGLGFDSAAQLRPMAEFSGGWQMRVMLARALLAPADLLLLDEPTNHLDLDSLIWLAGHLKRDPRTILIISHDREFLDEVCTHSLHLDGQGASLYVGGYSELLRQRAERKLVAEREAEVLERQRKHLQAFVDRFRAKASKARQAQSRVKMLEKLGSAPSIREEGGIDLHIPAPLKTPPQLMALKDLSLGYDGTPVLSGVDLLLAPGDRLGLLGRNGAGKSTLVKGIAGVLPALSGERVTARDLSIGYFSQSEVEQIEGDEPPIELLRRRVPMLGEQAARNWLGRYRYSGDMALSPVRLRSGGEKARLALALILHSQPNLLLLDEPTNHLDVGMREALAEALQDYAGAVVLVSHDRALLGACCDQFLLVHQGAARPFDGDLTDYANWSLGRQSRDTAGSSDAASAVVAAPAPVAKPATDSRQERERRKALQAEVRRAEQRITELGERLKRVVADLEAASHAAAIDVARCAALDAEQQRLRRDLDEWETRWLELSECA